MSFKSPACADLKVGLHSKTFSPLFSLNFRS